MIFHAAKISIADYTDLLSIGLRLYYTKEKDSQSRCENTCFFFVQKIGEKTVVNAEFAICRTRYIAEFGKI